MNEAQIEKLLAALQDACNHAAKEVRASRMADDEEGLCYYQGYADAVRHAYALVREHQAGGR